MEKHYSVGALIEKDGKYLLIDRVKPPFGFAGPAGHVDPGEKPEEALVREVEEETGLVVDSHELLIEKFAPKNTCSRGVTGHQWYVYRCTTSGNVKRSEEETKSIGWYTVDEIKQLELEPMWEQWFKKLNII